MQHYGGRVTSGQHIRCDPRCDEPLLNRRIVSSIFNESRCNLSSWVCNASWTTCTRQRTSVFPRVLVRGRRPPPGSLSRRRRSLSTGFSPYLVNPWHLSHLSIPSNPTFSTSRAEIARGRGTANSNKRRGLMNCVDLVSCVGYIKKVLRLQDEARRLANAVLYGDPSSFLLNNSHKVRVVTTPRAIPNALSTPIDVTFRGPTCGLRPRGFEVPRPS